MSSKTITLSIEGMTCANCVSLVECGLSSMSGVINVKVNLITKFALVEIIPGAATIAKLKQTVKDAGYEALVVGDSASSLNVI